LAGADCETRQTLNPVGAILSAAMMLDELGVRVIAERIRSAVATTCAAGICTRDVGGSSTSDEVTNAIIVDLRKAIS
jgi:tartrate dehydrogenase/decarboxylase/D-malate dehydrogenase